MVGLPITAPKTAYGDVSGPLARILAERMRPPSKPLVSGVTDVTTGETTGAGETAPIGVRKFDLPGDVRGPRTSRLADALYQQAYAEPISDPLNAAGSLALVLAGNRQQRRFEEAEAARAELPMKRLQAFSEQGGDWNNPDELMSTGDPLLAEYGIKLKMQQAETERALALEEAKAARERPQFEIFGNGVYELPRTADGELKKVMDIPKGVIPMTPDQISAFPNLDPRAQWGWDQDKQSPVLLQEAPDAVTDIGKLQQAYQRGEFGPPGTPQADGLFAAMMEAEQRKLQGWITLDDPAERLLAGFGPNDKRIVMRGPDGDIKTIDPPSTFTDLPPDKDGNVFQRNDLTNELKVVKAGTKAPTLPAGYRWKDEAKGIAEPIPGVPPKSELTETQSKMLFYYGRGMRANEDLKSIDTALTSLPDAFWYGVNRPTGNMMVDRQYQLAKAAANEFLIMLLRPDTGAAVTDQEFEIYGPTYLPMPGDDAATVEKKRQMRAWAMYTLKATLGNARPMADQFDVDLMGRPSNLGLVNPASPSGSLAIPETLPSVSEDGLIHLPDGRVLRPSGG